MQLSQMGYIVGCVAPVDVGGAPRLGAHINMAKYNHVTFLIYFGVMGNICTVTVLAGTNSLGAGGVAMGYNYSISTGGVPLLTPFSIAPLTAVGAGGVAHAATVDNEIVVIELDAAELVAPMTNYYVGVNLSGAAAALATVIAICSEPRWAADPDIAPDPTVA